MKVNGKEVGFLWSIGSFCDYQDYVVNNQDVSLARANVIKAAAMTKAYADVNGGEYLTVEELSVLPVYVLAEIVDEMKKAEDAGTTRTVETEEKKPKSAARK